MWLYEDKLNIKLNIRLTGNQIQLLISLIMIAILALAYFCKRKKVPVAGWFLFTYCRLGCVWCSCEVILWKYRLSACVCLHRFKLQMQTRGRMAEFCTGSWLVSAAVLWFSSQKKDPRMHQIDSLNVFWYVINPVCNQNGCKQDFQENVSLIWVSQAFVAKFCWWGGYDDSSCFQCNFSCLEAAGVYKAECPCEIAVMTDSSNKLICIGSNLTNWRRWTYLNPETRLNVLLKCAFL